MPKSTSRTRKSFIYNIVLPSAFAVVLFVATLFFIVIPSFENAMMDRKREMIRELTNAATSILDKYYKDETEGLLTREEAMKTAVSRIQYLRYGDENKDYFWVTDTIPVMVIHPYRPELNGQNLSSYQDPHGKKLFVESVKIAEGEGQGYIDYMWQWKDDSTHIVPKLSYVRAFRPWGWIIGTGIYIQDVKKEIATLTASFVRISIIISLITALILFYIGRQSLRIENRRRRAEEELHESREKYRSLVEASTEGLLMVMDGLVIFTNAIIQRMAGMDEDEMLDRSPALLLEMPEGLETLHGLTGGDPVPPPFESVLKRSDGSGMPVLVNISPVIFNERQAVICSVRDLTHGGTTKEELLRDKEQFKALMDTLQIGIFRATMDPRGRFVDANDTALQILGYKDLGELSETYILEMFTDMEDKKGFRTQLLKYGFLKNQILKLKRKNGQLAVVNISLVAIGEAHERLLCDGIIEDISFRQKEPAFSESLANEYTRFSQLFFRQVRHVMKPTLMVSYKDPAGRVASRMTQELRSAALVTAEGGEMLGIITDSDFRSRISPGDGQRDPSAFEIMSSPVIVVRQDALVLEALSILKNRNISHLVVTGAEGLPVGILDRSGMQEILNAFPAMLSISVDGKAPFTSLAAFRGRFIQSVIPLIENTNNPTPVFNSLALLSDNITHHIIEMVQNEMGPPPAEFCFFSLGSDARMEQTLNTDQDNALIFKDVPDAELGSVQEYFREFGRRVCTALHEAGYMFCKGNIMAMNPEWCQPVSGWKTYFHRWINKASAKDLLDINIFFDIRAIYGEKSLVAGLQQYIFDLTDANPAYLFHLAQNTLMLKPQVGFWGNILLETAGAPPETVNIKEAIMPVVNFARIYALRNRIEAPSTVGRLDLLLERNILPEASCTNAMQAFKHLNLMRLKHQAYLVRQDLKPDNLINTKALSELDKVIIKKVIAGIGTLLTRLSYDFKGSI